ncbi:hypothetical protein K5X82_15745 [Halosquirtibacter xylanolyticus]|uniref:hypothetical protein n=1 Tax=Halosquirtibacter xylanolyticus TaxID=3374599 RepID=UPI003749E378|nr:hypothetical protein K5X82_15745 [Prolixibacteraceae bacterium]
MEESKIIKQKFNPGDVAELNSGSVEMTIEQNIQPTPTSPVYVVCVYHINNTDCVRNIYNQDVLTLLYQPKKHEISIE